MVQMVGKKKGLCPPYQKSIIPENLWFSIYGSVLTVRNISYLLRICQIQKLLIVTYQPSGILAPK